MKWCAVPSWASRWAFGPSAFRGRWDGFTVWSECWPFFSRLKGGRVNHQEEMGLGVFGTQGSRMWACWDLPQLVGVQSYICFEVWLPEKLGCSRGWGWHSAAEAGLAPKWSWELWLSPLFLRGELGLPVCIEMLQRNWREPVIHWVFSPFLPQSISYEPDP